MFIYATSKGELVFSERFNFTGEREEIVSATVEACAIMLIDYLGSI